MVKNNSSPSLIEMVWSDGYEYLFGVNKMVCPIWV